jgi:glycosyltransferase involved in cell wall biosynthesis
VAKLLHLFNIFGALTERAMLDYTLGLARRGWDLTIACETLAPEAPPTDLPTIPVPRIPVEPATDAAAQMQNIACNPISPDLLRQPFDLIHGHFGPRLLHAAPWLVRGTPVILSTYGYDVGRLLRDPAWIARYRWAADRGATFVALAQFMESRLLDLGLPRQNVRRIELGINLREHAFNPLPSPPHPRFVFIGRFVEKKGTDVLIDAMRLLARDSPAATLDLIGAGPNEPDLRQRVASLSLDRKVNFLGIIPFAKLFDHLRGCTALVQPSVTACDGDAEGAPMVLMSAQAVGVPCITTRHSGNPQTIPPEAQDFVVPERSPAALAAAMRAMAHLPPATRASFQLVGRKWIEEHFNLDCTIDRYDALYHELIERRPTTRL